MKLWLQSCLFGYLQWHQIAKGFKHRTRLLPGGELGQRERWGEAPEGVWTGGVGGAREYSQDKRERAWLSKGSKL